MRVYLNPQCDFGRGPAKWRTVEPALRGRFGPFDVEPIDSPAGLAAQVDGALAAGERIFIAAGGDGTVNLLLNALLAAPGDPEVELGAVGLGSSNDFHKPFRPEGMVGGIPVRMDVAAGRPCDVIAVAYAADGGRPALRYGLVNASIGITAEANALYNSRRRSIVLAKRISHDAAVVAVAVRTIVRFRNVHGRLAVGGAAGETRAVTNLGVVKNPHFAGGLCYDAGVAPGDGQLAVALAEDMTRREAIATLAGLYRHEFSGRPKTRTWRADRVAFASAAPFALEIDGEIVTADRAEFHLEPGRIRCCA